MSFADILKVVEGLINAALQSGLIKTHNDAKTVIEAKNALTEHADAERAALQSVEKKTT